MTEASREPRVSVVIPTRNRLSLLRRAVASVLSQTEPDLEIIVVDDGSTDGTADYLRELSDGDARVRPIRSRNPGGGAVARNLGIAAAKGRWIAFLDDDDEWLPMKLALQFETLAAHPGSVACSSWYWQRRSWRRPKLARVPTLARFDELLGGNVMGGASCCLCDAETLRRIGCYDPTFRSGQDWELWTKLSQAGTVVACAEPTVVYSEHLGPRISHDMNAQYQGGRSFYWKYRSFMSPKTRLARLAHQCFFMSRQRERGLRRRLKYLMIAMRASDTRTALRYARSTGPRLLRDWITGDGATATLHHGRAS